MKKLTNYKQMNNPMIPTVSAKIKKNHMNEEQKLQAICTQWFNNKFLKYSKCCFAVNNNSLSSVQAMQLKAIGLRAGVSDVILVCPKAITIYIEMKTTNGTQSNDQKEFQKQIENLGHTYIIARSLEQFQNIVHTHFTQQYQ